MRMWTLAPGLLDRQGLIAAWRESLLAQAVLAGKTKGYTNHPQLVRFKRTADPVRYVGAYLHVLADEADGRSYRFDRSRVILDEGQAREVLRSDPRISVMRGQIEYEFEHLLKKLAVRTPALVPHVTELFDSLQLDSDFSMDTVVHPLFAVVPGGIEPWEIR